MKVLYNIESQSVSTYPRADDEPVVGLDLVYLVLTQVETPAPSPTAVPTWEVDLDALEYRQSWTEPEPPPPPEPDWTAFNLAMIPPVGESDFEFWLDQFKILYQSSLATAAASGNAVETQRIYDLLKLQHPPTTEQIAAWQALANLHHVPLTF